MTDIVERLRAYIADPFGTILTAEVAEAADEVERLRSQLATEASLVDEHLETARIRFDRDRYIRLWKTSAEENERLRAEMCLTSERWEAENERLRAAAHEADIERSHLDVVRDEMRAEIERLRKILRTYDTGRMGPESIEEMIAGKDYD